MQWNYVHACLVVSMLKIIRYLIQPDIRLTQYWFERQLQQLQAAMKRRFGRQ